MPWVKAYDPWSGRDGTCALFIFRGAPFEEDEFFCVVLCLLLQELDHSSGILFEIILLFSCVHPYYY
jgi:hypothetical protein